MAFQKTIQQTGTGIGASYWRIAGLYSDFIKYQTRLVLVGYLDANIRQLNAEGIIDQREFNLTPAQLGALFTGRPQFNNSTYFEINAKRLYEFITNEPRTIPQGAHYALDTGVLTIPATGEVIAQADVTLDEEGRPIKIPSEFANAVAI